MTNEGLDGNAIFTPLDSERSHDSTIYSAQTKPMTPKHYLKPFFSTLAIIAVLAAGSHRADAHCQVPCGIFADQLRFESMLEDQATIAKANVEVAKYLKGMQDDPTAVAVNQTLRWVTTKEEHCVKIQETIAQYFMAQKIKPGDDQDAYVKKLTTAHAVMQAAMKAKQDPSDEVAAALKEAIFDFYRAYEGKEPNFAH